MIKSLKRNDIRYTPFVANKSWNSQNKRFEDLISWQSGSESGSLFLTFFDYGDGTQMSVVSSAFSSAIAYQQQDADFLKFRVGQEITGSTFYPLGNQFYNPETNPVNIDDSYQSLVYNNVKNLYYKESENPTQIFGLESLDPSKVNRNLPKQISVFNVPVNKFGEKIQPKSIKIDHDLPIGHTYVIDDGNNNLKISGSTFSDVQNTRYNCISASIIHTNLNQTYNGTQRSASISTSPSNLTVSTTYNGNTSSPTNAGTYTIQSEISDGFYCGIKSDNFVINKANATVTVTNTSNTYTGNRFDVTVTTTPSNLNYSILYRKNSPTGPISNPIDVGTYYATVTIEDTNYSGTGTGISAVTLPVSVISFSPISDVTYGEIWEIQPNAVDSVNKFPIVFTITSGNTLASIINNKISLNPSKTATTLGSVTVTATTVPTISGVSPVSTTKTFTINPKKLTITGVSTTNKVIGSTTTITINNQSQTLNGIVSGDTVSINTSPSTGTVTSTSNLGVYPVTFSNYTITGTHVSKYTLQQPGLTVQITSAKIVLNSTLNFNYDTKERNAKDILTQQSINSIDNLIINYYSNSQRIGGEKYNRGILRSSDGIRPTNAGIYTVEVINDELIAIETVNVNISILKAPAYVEFTNLYQGGPVWITKSEKQSRIKPVSEEINDVNITDIQIKDRDNKLIKLPDLINSTSILYNGSTTKPNTVGTITLTATINSPNVYFANQKTLIIGNFIYIVTDNLYETYDFPSDNLVKEYSSSTYNLRKYFDPSVTGSWPSVVSTYSELSNFPYNDISRYRYNVNAGISIGLTGAGGGAYIFNEYKVTDKNVSIEYYDNSDTLIYTDTSKAIKNSAELNKSYLNNKIVQNTHFYISDDNTSITFTLSSTDADLYIDDTSVVSSSGGDNISATSTYTKYFKRGYYKLKLVYHSINANSKLYLTFNPQITFTTLISNNYGGGSGASIGVILPAKYIIQNNLQQVKFVVGQSGYADFNQDIPEITSRLDGQPAGGSGNLIANGYIYQNNSPLAYFLYNAPLLRNYTWIIATTPQNSPSSDLIFVGKDVTQAQLNDFGIKTELSRIYRIKAGDKLDISSTATVDDYLSIGYYVWDATLGYSGINKSYSVIYSNDYQAPDRQYSELSGQLIVPSTFKSTDILIIGFEDSSPYRRSANLTSGPKGLNDLIVNVKLTRLPTPYNGGDTYFITGSSTAATIQNAYLGLIAGGGRTINGVNYGSSSVKGNAYNGELYPKNTKQLNPPLTSYPLYSEFKDYDEPSYAINLRFSSDIITSPYNQALYGNDGTNKLIGGLSVDVAKETNKNFGKGAGGSINYGTRGNFVLSGSNVLYEIYVNSSSVYNVTQVI